MNCCWSCARNTGNLKENKSIPTFFPWFLLYYCTVSCEYVPQIHDIGGTTSNLVKTLVKTSPIGILFLSLFIIYNYFILFTNYVGLSIRKSITDWRVTSSGKVSAWGRWLQAGQSSWKTSHHSFLSDTVAMFQPGSNLWTSYPS